MQRCRQAAFRSGPPLLPSIDLGRGASYAVALAPPLRPAAPRRRQAQSVWCQWENSLRVRSSLSTGKKSTLMTSAKPSSAVGSSKFLLAGEGKSARESVSLLLERGGSDAVRRPPCQVRTSTCCTRPAERGGVDLAGEGNGGMSAHSAQPPARAPAVDLPCVTFWRKKLRWVAISRGVVM